jgi:hypothetical protein
MSRYKNQLAGLSLPINVFSVLLHILAVFTIILSQLNCFTAFKALMLWIGLPCLAVSIVLIILFRGYYLLVQHTRLCAGFMLLIISLLHITALTDFGGFLNTATDGKNNPWSFLHGTNVLAGILVVVEFVTAMALIIGAWIRPVSILLALLFTFYALLFWNQHPFSGDTGSFATFSFGIDNYLISQLNISTAFVFCLFISVIALVGTVFGNKIRSNSVKLNWGIIPVYTILSAGLAILLHWYALIFIVPLSISLCLIIYRSGGKLLGNHFGSLLLAAVMAVTILFFQNQMGISRKQENKISTKK